MIWSVSTLDRRSGTAVPVWTVNFSMSVSAFQVGRCGEVAQHRRGGGDRRRDEMGTAALALPAFEVAVGRGGAALPRLERVRVHAQAHRAAGEAPLCAGRGGDLVQT